ncbi:MAG: hypothetical protein Q7R73_05425, partial [bacterium]|nr:hypothetical protein [bacterium]
RIMTATTSATTTEILKTDFFNMSFGVAGASLRQHHYRWREDDGGEVAASWATTENNPLSSGVFTGDRRRLRFSVSNSGAASSNITYRLEYASSSCLAAGYIPVPSTPTSEEWRMDPSYYLSEEGVTTALLSVPSGKSFASGYTKNASNQTSAHNLTASGYSEFEYSIKSTATAQVSLTYCFRLTNAGTSLNTYSVTPSITITNQATTPRPQTGGAGGEGSGGGGAQAGGSGQGGGSGGEGSGGGGQQSGGSGQGGGSGSQEFVPWLMPWFGYVPNMLEAGAASLASVFSFFY